MRQEIYELLEAINRADSLAQVHERAMDFIASAVGSGKVAILLPDEAGIMRFVASRGLSAAYQKAVEGHSPWPVGSQDAQPVCISDVEEAALEKPLQEAICAEGIRALAFIPLSYERRLEGKFMVYFDAPHKFTPDELRLAQGIATQLAAAIHRRHSAEALRQSEARYRALVEQVKDYAFFSTDKQGRPTTWNEGVQRILGFDRPAFVHQDILERIFTPEDVQEKIPEQEFQRAARAGTANNNRWMRRKDGSRFWAEGVTTAIRDQEGKLVGFSKLFRDSTTSRETEQQLTRLRHRLAADLKAMTYLQELGARAITPGAGFASLLGDFLTAALSIMQAEKGNIQLLDEKSRALRIVAHRGFNPQFLDYFQRVVDQAASCAAARRAGQRIVVEDVTTSPIFQDTPALQVLLAEGIRAVQSTPLVSREGKVLGIISTHFTRPHRPGEDELRFLDILCRQAADVFERSRAEAELREAQEELAHSNLELDQKVQQRTASLAEAMHSMETLLYTIAHDLRAPNRAMQGYADLLANAHADQLDEEGRFFVKRIGEAALKNEALIRDLLEYGRLSHAELACRVVDPGKIIRAAVQGVELEILAKKAGLEVSDRWPLVMANEAALSHIVTNLLANALKYTRPGVPPRVRIFPEPVKGIDGKGDARFLRVCVRDNGIGVPLDQRETIFQPFQRASNVNEAGTGIGLAIVRKAAERMGGRAGVDSHLAEGSTFWVELRTGG